MTSKGRANGHPRAPQVLLALTITAPSRPGEDGTVQMTSKYDPATTVSLLREVADRYERAGRAPADGGQG